jgi:hypothetical protein
MPTTAQLFGASLRVKRVLTSGASPSRRHVGCGPTEIGQPVDAAAVLNERSIDQVVNAGDHLDDRWEAFPGKSTVSHTFHQPLLTRRQRVGHIEPPSGQCVTRASLTIRMIQRLRLAHIGALLCFALAHSQTCWADPGSPLESKLAELAGRSARQCGLVSLHHDAAEGWRCAVSAESRNEPFWFALQLQGEDSQVWTAAIRTPGGAHIILSYDSNPNGGRVVDFRFWEARCPGSIDYLAQTTPPFRCRGK